MYEKLSGYGLALSEPFDRIGVAECWLVDLGARASEVLGLSFNGPEVVARVVSGETLRSLSLPNLELELADTFRE